MHSTPDDIDSYTPRAGHGLPHDSFNAIVGTRADCWMGTHDGGGHFTAAVHTVPTWLVPGEVVAVQIARRLVVGGAYDTTAVETVLRDGGPACGFGISAELGFNVHRPR